VNAAELARYKLHATLAGITLAITLLCIYLSYYDVTNTIRGLFVLALAGLSIYWGSLVPRRWRAAKRTGRYSIAFPDDLEPVLRSDVSNWVIEITYHSEPHTFDVDYIGPPDHGTDYFDRVTANPLWEHAVSVIVQSVVLELGSKHGLTGNVLGARRLPD